MTQTQYLILLLKKNNLSRQKLATHIGCSYDTLRSKISADSIQSLSNDCFVKLCKTFDMTVDEFIRNADAAVDTKLQDALEPDELEMVLAKRNGLILSSHFSMTEEEQLVILQYRKHPEYHNAVKKLLGFPVVENE